MIAGDQKISDEESGAIKSNVEDIKNSILTKHQKQEDEEKELYMEAAKEKKKELKMKKAVGNQVKLDENMKIKIRNRINKMINKKIDSEENGLVVQIFHEFNSDGKTFNKNDRYSQIYGLETDDIDLCFRTKFHEVCCF